MINTFQTYANNQKNMGYLVGKAGKITGSLSRVIKHLKYKLKSLFFSKKAVIPTKTMSNRTVNKQTSNSTLSLSQASLTHPASSKMNAIYKNYEKASQGLSDLHSIQTFKKDILTGYSVGNLNDSQYSTLSTKVTASLFKLVRQGKIQNLSMTVLTPLVGKDKAKELMTDVDAQLKNKLHATQWGAAQNPQKLLQSLSQKGGNLNSVSDAINFKREILSRVSAKELPLEKGNNLLQSYLPTALKKLAKKPDSARRLNDSLLKKLVDHQTASSLSRTCRLTLQTNDQKMMNQLEKAPLPPDELI
ncbi:MAG: hypothetical protein KAG53_01730 [Endozoicomonadaceae bacterium]|nr:hypothetical protein [Endozoicomonadaceae bacterium]